MKGADTSDVTAVERLWFFVLSVLLALSASSARAELIEQTVKTAMRDGIELEATLVLPAKAAELPTIVVRTPYGRQQHLEEARFWAAYGYAVLIQDTRGKFGSAGEYVPFLNEHADGSETLDWVVEQAWSNGRVGMWGSSYLAFCQLVLASSGHPALKSIMPVSGWLQEKGAIQDGGAHHIMLSIPWILHEESQTKRPIVDVDLEALFEYLPLIDVFESIGLPSKIWNEEFDFSSLEAFSAADIAIPALHVTGWNDFVHPATLDIYQQTLGGPAAAQQRLMIGPWFHDQFYTTYTEAGDEDFGPHSAMGREALMRLSLDWFEATLKRETPAIDTWPRARVFLMGLNEWRDYSSWPPPHVESRTLYLGAGVGANSSAGDGYLALAAPPEPGADRYLFDPMNPVPTYGGANFHFLLHLLGVKDQRDIERRQDVLVYTSAPLEADMEIVGPMTAVVYAATEGIDTDFTAKLVEVRASGYARIIEEGIVRASYRDGSGQRSLLEPGRIYPLTIDIGSTAIRVPAGHRLRLEISSSNFPKYDRNPNTGEEALFAHVLKAVAQTIHRGGEFPSHIVLPVVPADSLGALTQARHP